MTGFVVLERTFDEYCILDMKGDLTKQSEEPLLSLKHWNIPSPEHKRYVILNFTEVPYINSMGIAILIRIVRGGIQANYQAFAYGLSSHYEKMFRMVGLTQHLVIYPDEYAILQRIQSSISQPE
jgi:anti-anti-sigma factor